jgi:pilus assembly protein CpaE
VHEFLVSPPSADDLAGAVERLLRRVRVDSGKRLTVAVYSAKGGLGTTTIAVNLAFAFAARDTHQRVALADFVVSGGDAGMMLDLRPSYDIGDLALKLDRIDGSLLESILSQAPGRVSVLPASERPETLETVDGAAAATILKELRGHYPVTVVDCEHHPSDRMLAALDAADRVVLVTQLNVAAMRSAQRTLALCRRLGYPDEKLLIVANRTHATDLVSAADAAKVLERELFFRLPNDYEVCTAALTRGLPVVKHEPNSSLARAFGTLAAKIGGDESDTEIENRTNGQKPRLSRLFGIGRK